jgi:hypothetical protein
LIAASSHWGGARAGEISGGWLIDEVIHTYEKRLLVRSENAIISKWVGKEVETAFDKERQRKTLVVPCHGEK